MKQQHELLSSMKVVALIVNPNSHKQPEKHTGKNMFVHMYANKVCDSLLMKVSSNNSTWQVYKEDFVSFLIKSLTR